MTQRYGPDGRQRPAAPESDLYIFSTRNIKIRARLFRAQHGRCYLCGNLFRRRKLFLPTVDHVRPKSKGWGKDLNSLLACTPCNRAKANREPYPCELIYLFAVNLTLEFGPPDDPF